MKQKALLASLLFLSLVIVSVAVNSSDPATQKSAMPVSEPLNGQWRAKVQFQSGAFASIKDLEFLYVFNMGGTLTESSNYDAAPPVPPAYGIWKRIGPNRYLAKYEFYMTLPPQNADKIISQGWLPAGRGVFTDNITLSGDGKSFTSTMKYEAFDSSGKVAEGGGTAQAKAVKLEF